MNERERAERRYYIGRATGVIAYGRAGTGNEQLGIEFRIEDPRTPRNGARYTWYGSLASDDSVALVEESMRACGWGGRWGKHMASELTKNEVQLTFERDGNDWRLAFVGVPSVAMASRLDDDEEKDLFARMNERGRLARVAGVDSAGQNDEPFRKQF